MRNLFLKDLSFIKNYSVKHNQFSLTGWNKVLNIMIFQDKGYITINR